MTKLTALFLISLTTAALSSEPSPFTINTKKWSHVLDDHFISITINPTDLLQGKVYGLQMNSTMAILKGLAPAYIRIGSADTAKYTFKRTRYPSDVVKPDDEYTVTETHWMVFNEVAQKAGLDVIVCLNAAHRSEGTKKWDSRNSLELISFSDSQGYNLTWQLGYEVQGGDDLSGIQFGKDLNRLRTILNAFPRYQHSKLIGPDIRVIHKKEDIDFWNDVLLEAGPTLDAVTWHPRWPQPSKMKVSENSDLGYEFPVDHLEWDKAQLSKILQKTIFRNPVWIGETKRESTGTFAEGLMWARRLALAAKVGIEVVMKQPNLMDVTHPKPEYWIALLHKKLLGKSVLETRSVGNNTDLTVISHCTNPYYWTDKPEKLQDGPVTVYGINMGGTEQKIQIKGTWTGKSQLLFQYVLTSGSDPDAVFSQMTYLNGEPLMMTDDGKLPDIIPKIKKLERGLTMKLPPYSVGFWVVPEARVKICQVQQNLPTINIETLTPSFQQKSTPKTLENIRDINQFIVDKLKNPESESEEVPEMKIEATSSESSEKDMSVENHLQRVTRRIREANSLEGISHQIKTIMRETEEFLSNPEGANKLNFKSALPKATHTMEQRVQGLAEGISDAIKFTNQEQEFKKFLEDSGLQKDFGRLLMNDRRDNVPGLRAFQPYFHTQNPDGELDGFEVKERLRRSIAESEEISQESIEDEEEPLALELKKFSKKISVKNEEEIKNKKQDVVIPHQPDLKGLEERYKQIVHSKLQDGKRKIDDIKRKIKDETEITEKIKPPETVNDIQEEIIKKEIELLEKTEETVADILKSQKKRQETFEDIIFDELNDVKGERIRELKEMHKNQKKHENTIVKRQVQTPLSKPLMKTVEYIEKNFNLEPETVRKIKRSLEERMGEILRNYDTKKSLETKKRLAPLKEERRIKKPVSDRKTEHLETKMRSEKHEEKDEERFLSKDQPKEKNFIRKASTSQPHHKSVKKPVEEPTHQRRKSEDVKKPYEDDDDSFELFNEKKMSEPVKKPERRRLLESPEERKSRKPIAKTLPKDTKTSEEHETKKEHKVEKEEKKESKKTEKTVEETKSEPPVEKIKNDKQRRESMLKEISLMVEKMNLNDGSGSKKMKEDEDISEEFESDRRPRGIKRRPRKAEMTEAVEKVKVEEDSQAVKPTLESKLSKGRKRVRLNRKHKEMKKAGTEEEDSSQRKRHLLGLERPLLDLEKKKLNKPKLRKLNPKFHSQVNELLTDDKPQLFEIPVQDKEVSTERSEGPMQQEDVKQQEVPNVTPEPLATATFNPNEELKKDLEEIVEEKIFLEQGSETSKDKSETSGKESSQKKETDNPEETPTPTEGYIIVEPTEEFDSGEAATEKAADEGEGKLNFVQKEMKKIEAVPKIEEEEKKNDMMTTSEKEMKKLETVPKTEEEEMKNDMMTTSEKEMKKIETVPNIKEEEKKYDMMTTPEKEMKKLETVPKTEEEEKKNDMMTTSEKESENLGKNIPSADDIVTMAQITKLESLSEDSWRTQNEDSSSSSMESAEDVMENPENDSKAEEDVGQRKRRATFLAHDEEDDEDYSSEERIQKFKQMIYRKSPTKKPVKNEVRPSSGMGMGADEFLRMAGSTVRVMFDNVIPEAYGQTKNKIQNMGISEYIKEFGKIVQQMKNLDQIFLNIGEAAVKGYIKGNKAEKGPYIQVISRKKRGIKNEDSTQSDAESSEMKNHEAMQTDLKSPGLSLPKPPNAEPTGGSSEYATTGTDEESIAAGQRRNWENTRDTGTTRRESGKSVHEIHQTRSVEAAETSGDTQKKKMEPAKELEVVGTPKTTKDVEDTKNHKQSKIQPRKKPELQTLKTILKENAVGKRLVYVPEDLQEKIFSPWIKTTKDFIQQALTTLKRQRELSEILANDIMNGEMTKRAIGKREAGDEVPKLPVYHTVPPAANKKREAQENPSDESLIRRLRGLQPGVYVVPTEEMTNIRSEQIMSEAKQKSGMPNVVTLNIYYDKKNADASARASDTTSQDTVTYYQNKVWNPATNQYDQTNQYLNLPSPVVSQVQVTPGLQTQALYTAEPRIAELPASRLIQYPTPFHYAPVQKIYPAYVPNTQPVFGPMYYLPQENRFGTQSPGTKRQWREFKSRSSGIPVMNNAWNIQYDVPGSAKLSPSSYNKNYKFLTQDKKRSVEDFKMDPNWSETVLPFWKFFSTTENKNKDGETESAEKQEAGSVENVSSEDVFAENRKRAKAMGEKNSKTNSIEQVTEEKVPEEEEVAEEEVAQEEKSRKRRSVDFRMKNRKVSKRSSPYVVEFREHDIVPEWFGTYQEIDNGLDSFPPHIRRSHIVSTPWSEEDEELLNILEADDELSLVDMDDDDYYFSNDNTLQHLRRYPRSTDQFESNMIKSNMIYKMPMDGDHLKPKVLGMTGIKKLTDEDSSLETQTKSRTEDMKTTTLEELRTPEHKEAPQQTTATHPSTTAQPSVTGMQPFQNGTGIFPRNPHDDTFYYFFKYAYDSLVKVMKSMTEFF